MKIAVVILNWNGRNLLEQFLPSVVSFSEEAQVYVADNASADSSVEYLEKHWPGVKLIQNKENGGYAKGYNDALKQLSEDIFILLNSDVEVTPNWLKSIIDEFESCENTAALQPKILDYRKKDTFEYAGAAGGFLDKFGYPYCRGRIFETIEKDEGQYNNNHKIFWASGACLAIRKNAFFEAGQLDEDYFAHQEEIDLCWRLHNLGYEVKAIGNSVVYHLGGATLNNQNPKKTFFNFRNSLYSLLKNAPKKRLSWIIFSRLLLDGLAGLKFLAELKPGHTLAIVQAHFDFYKNFEYMRKKRKIFPKKRKYFGKASVLYAYYVLGRKKFSEL
ncbi:MAG TPA: glycosyltransferase family 2 protein [Salinimicrobium sp.]|nr:glycosyltransferase family 2 protein [Salinimicrobium sp.]